MDLYETVPFPKAQLPIKVTRAVIPAEGSAVAYAPYPHWHEHLEILQFYSGIARIFIDGVWADTVPGDVYVVNPSELHTVVQGATDTDYCFLIVSPQMLGSDGADAYGAFWQNLATRRFRFRRHIAGDREVCALIDRIAEEYAGEQPGYELNIRGDLFRLMGHLYRHYRDTAAGRRTNTGTFRVKPVLAAIEGRYAEPLTTRALAEEFGVNVSYFCRAFRQATGMTAAAYIRACRLEQAARLLDTGLYSVSDAATRCGFDSLSYFSSAFRKQFGVLPGRYARETLPAQEDKAP